MYLNEEKLIGCETFWVVINTTTRRPDNLALHHTHFEKFDTDSIVKPIQKITIPEVFTNKNERRILLSDIDIVNHANNVKYLEWCLDVANVEMVLNNSIKALNLNYLQELNYNDTIEIHHNENSFLITKEGKSCFALEIEI
jgi:acyl-ACP thioesterase